MSIADEFESALETYRREAESGFQYLYAHLGMHAVLAADKATLDAVNRTPLFWRTVDGALASAFLITLGRLFDQNSVLNLDRLVGMAQQNPEIFSHVALAARKRKTGMEDETQIEAYVKTAYLPGSDDFREMRKQVKTHRAMYEANYKLLRDKVFAHKELVADSDIQDAYGKTSVRELQTLFSFLLHVHKELWQLLYNGRKPDWNFPVRSIDDIVAVLTSETEKKGLRERVIAEAKTMLEALSRTA